MNHGVHGVRLKGFPSVYSVYSVVKKLLNHLGYKIQTGFDLGRDCLKGFVLVLLGDPVFAQAQGQVLGVGHGRDAIGVDGLHLLHQAHNIGKLGQHRRDFLFLDFDPGEVGHALHIGFGQ